MSKTLRNCVLGLGCVLSLSSFAASPSNFHPKRLIVKLKQDNPAYLNDISGVSNVQHLFANHYVVYTNSLEATEKNLRQHQLTEYVERDYQAKPRELAKFAPVIDVEKNMSTEDKPFNDPYFSKQWSFLDATSNGISVSKAYQEARGDNLEEVIVAVVDTGVHYKHDDLKNVMWINDKEIPDNKIDDDGNGYVDDIHGINTLQRDQNGKATGNPADGHGHGTHVAGIIGAQQNNNIGIAGIASKVKIMAIRTVPNSGDEKDVDVIESFIYAAKNGARIINCSFGKDVNEGGMSVYEAIKYIGEQYGVLVVAAAGNDYGRNIDTNRTYPASYENENLMVVASTAQNGKLSFFSNIGKNNVDVAAPGSSIYSTYIDNKYASLDGTSMASPTAAGVAAETLSHNPHLTGVELKKLIMSSVTKVKDFTDRMQSGGRVDLFKAITKPQDL